MIERKKGEGSLSVNLEADSYFLSQSLPIELRDGRMKLVKKFPIGGESNKLDLPVGLYEVSAVLQDGQRYSQLVSIYEGQHNAVKLSPHPAVIIASTKRKATKRKATKRKATKRKATKRKATKRKATKRTLNFEVPTWLDKLNVTDMISGTEHTELFANASDKDTISNIELINVVGAKLETKSESAWRFIVNDHFNSVPVASFKAGNKTVDVSLPVNPEGYMIEETACLVQFEPNRSRLVAQAWIDPERKVTSALQRMLTSRYILEASDIVDKTSEVANESDDLLRGKYRDPVGAVLGGLILQKVGKLGLRKTWVENLARDFTWLPDGKVLLAKLLVDERSDPDIALDLIRSTSNQTLMFTESFSLLLNMVRRWPWENGKEARAQALEQLVKKSSVIAWDSFTLTLWHSEDE
jgi:hypothetical protein